MLRWLTHRTIVPPTRHPDDSEDAEVQWPPPRRWDRVAGVVGAVLVAVGLVLCGGG